MRLCEKPDDEPLVIITKLKNALRIVALNRPARACGLAQGMALADAEARHPGLQAVHADPEKDRALHLAIAEACLRFTPLVAMPSDDSLILDVTGCAHLSGGEQRLLERVRKMTRLGRIETALAIADTPDAASATARFSRIEIVPQGQAEHHARALPVTAIPATTEIHTALKRAGLRTIGDLLDRPSAMLSARFGAGLSRSVIRIAGREDIRIIPWREPPAIFAEHIFAEPATSMDAIGAATSRLLSAVLRDLETAVAGSRILELAFFRVDGRMITLIIETSRPTRDARLLSRLFAEKRAGMEDVLEPGFGFDVMRLSVLRMEPLHHRQAVNDLSQATEPGHDDTINTLIDTLATRYGSDSIERFVPANSHIPERTSFCISAMSHATSFQPVSNPEEPPLRPLHLFDPPHLIEALAEVPDGPPLRFRWRNILHHVLHAEGPERIAPEWWRADLNERTRDYYRIEDSNGRRFWIFRHGLYDGKHGSPKWFVHGIFA
jgi:protein ImuB